MNKEPTKEKGCLVWTLKMLGIAALAALAVGGKIVFSREHDHPDNRPRD